ncbi:sugar nucleotide-binding protein [Bacterioplanoides sp.]|uniref:sugar nucleotide-binding protein n=1 Tax=Bacterioplanoides sp. TaxID=2066072 RepID=UPI003AFFD323
MSSSAFQTYVIGADQPVGQHLVRNLTSQGLMYQSIALESQDKLPASSSGQPFFVIIPSLTESLDPAQVEFWLERAREMDAGVIYLSSLALFGYRSDGTVKEDDEQFAETEYAAQLQALEARVRDNERHVIVRSGQLLALQNDDFASQLLAKARVQEPMHVDMQRLFDPTLADDVADVLFAILRQLACSDDLFGTYHFSGVEAVSAFGFAEALMALASQYEDFSKAELGSQEGGMMPSPWAASSDNTRIFHTFGIKPKAWRQGLGRLLQKYYRVEES